MTEKEEKDIEYVQEFIEYIFFLSGLKFSFQLVRFWLSLKQTRTDSRNFLT